MKTATFSPCRQYRYSLLRRWDESKPLCQFIGLNPSTADETNNDPTVTRCINYAKQWGFGGLIMSNIFAYRATDPRVMKAQPEPIGSENDEHLKKDAERSGLTVFAWGTHGAFQGRGYDVAKMLPGGHCLKVTKAGHPSHPLYLKADLKPVVFDGYGN